MFPSRIAESVNDIEVSVVVPAFNEEKLLGQTLTRLHQAFDGAGLGNDELELVVCDNASTDATAAIAIRHGAHVVHEAHRQISRARNAGAAVARGRYLFFVDADTWPSSALLAEAIAALRSGRVVGGGAIVCGRELTLPWQALVGAWNLTSRLGRLACGAFVYCRADAFCAVGGFDQSLYAAEELGLSRRLKRHGAGRGMAFHVITQHRLQTSMRKIELYTLPELLGMAVRGGMNPLRAIRDRRFLDAWYDGRR